MNPLRPKRQHTAYTLFVHETYPDIKTSQPDLKGQQIMPMVAKLWREKTAAEKQEWKVRAQATHSNNVDEDGVHIHDFHATMMHLLGIDHEQLTYKYQGRRFRLTDVHGHVVKPILA